jgi:hypothetical protein
MTTMAALPQPHSRLPGAVLIVTALAIVLLFLAHPGEHATDFPGFIAEQAANQARAAVVHGGFVLILAVQLAGYTLFTARIGWHNERAIAALVLFGAGALTHMPTIFTDGVIIPALAQRYIAVAPDQLAAARPIFVLCGIAVAWLGTLAQLLEGAGIALWGAALLPTSRLWGITGIVLGAAMIAAIAAALTGAPQLGEVPIAGLVIWPVIAGALMLSRKV